MIPILNKIYNWNFSSLPENSNGASSLASEA